MRLLAIDPGACAGWALFAGGQLDAAGVLLDGSPSYLKPWGFDGLIDRLVCEWPNAFEERNSVPNKIQDLFTMCIRAGRLIERAGVSDVTLVFAGDWKGNISKEITQRRVRKALTADELAQIPKLPASKLHNCYDACGIGLWALGRFGR